SAVPAACAPGLTRPPRLACVLAHSIAGLSYAACMRPLAYTLLPAILLTPFVASAAALSFGVATPNQKVRPADMPAGQPKASLEAAKNEFESFQVVFTATAGATGVAVKLAQPLAGPGGATIPAENVVLYRADYYNVSTPSNAEGAAGPWPDPLVPDVDV